MNIPEKVGMALASLDELKRKGVRITARDLQPFQQQIRDGHNEIVNSVKDIFAEKGDELLVNFAEIEGAHCVNNRLATGQIRKFLDAINRIDNLRKKGKDIDSEVILLKPQLAYSAGKQQDKVLPLTSVLFPAIDETARNTGQNFNKLNRFIEAIVAYHKYYGGQD